MKKKWAFITNNAARQPISSNEARYWKNLMRKLLKVGMEFELNLPEPKGTCFGSNNLCPCKRIDSGCWEKCIHEEENCLIKKEYGCMEAVCSNFVSICTVCKDYEKECKACAIYRDPEKEPKNIRAKIRSELHPNKSVGFIGETGVHTVTTDGSLLGDKGIEIITVGRRVDYSEFYKMVNNILSLAMRHGAYSNERCSIHMHVLAEYYENLVDSRVTTGVPNFISGMERNMPEIILANFHQLCRKYQNAMTWMTMGLDNPKHLTRWEKFRVSVLDVSPISMPMSKVSETISKKCAKHKYGWVNYCLTKFEDEDISRFHIEMRVADCILSPSIIAALGCMYYALVIKAIEISRHGLLEIANDDSWMTKQLEIKEDLMNNTGDWGSERFSNTSKLMRHSETLIEDSIELISQLKHILQETGEHVYDILTKLAYEPVALMRVQKKSWEEIERQFYHPEEKETAISRKIDRIIDLREVDSSKSMTEWVGRVIDNLAMDDGLKDMDLIDLEDDVTKVIMNKVNTARAVWSDKLGMVIGV